MKTKIESSELFATIADKLTFAKETDAWMIRGKSGQLRIAEREIIALHLANGKRTYQYAELEKAERTQWRKVWNKLSDEKKAEYADKANALFKDARKEYCDVINPLLKEVAANPLFKTERAQFALTKSGLVHVAQRRTYRPPVEVKAETPKTEEKK